MADTAQSLLDEFRAFLNDANAVVGFAGAGLWKFRQVVEAMPTDNPENPDPTFWIGDGDPNDPSSRAWAGWRRSAALQALDRGGMVEERLSQQWIVSVYTAWEHEYRPRWAALHGIDKSAVRLEMLGDLRLMRHDVVHHHGIATTHNSGSTKILRWFKPGQIMILNGQHFVQFLDEFPAQALADGAWS